MNKYKRYLITLLASLTVLNSVGCSNNEMYKEGISTTLLTNEEDINNKINELVKLLNNDSISIKINKNIMDIEELNNSKNINYDNLEDLFNIIECLYEEIIINYIPSKDSIIDFNTLTKNYDKYEINIKVINNTNFNNIYNNIKLFNKLNLSVVNIDNIDNITNILNHIGNRLDYQGNLYLELNDFDTNFLFSGLKSSTLFNNIYISCTNTNYLKYFNKLHAINCYLVINKDEFITVGHIENLYLYGKSNVSIERKVNNLYASGDVNVTYEGFVNKLYR